MNIEQNANAGTFPSGDHRGVQPEYGLTKREYFAGQALQGLLSNPSLTNMEIGSGKSLNDSVLAEYSVRMADLLLKQLSNESDR